MQKNYKVNQFKFKYYNNRAHKKGISCVTAVNVNGIDFASAGKDGIIKLWSLESNTCISVIEEHN